VNKDADTCYSFWIGASLKMLDKLHLADYRLSKAFTMSCQTPIGSLFSFLFLFSSSK
jgi:geranylgeranyl transferase type-1 subunit beta